MKLVKVYEGKPFSSTPTITLCNLLKNCGIKADCLFRNKKIVTPHGEIIIMHRYFGSGPVVQEEIEVYAPEEIAPLVRSLIQYYIQSL